MGMKKVKLDADLLDRASKIAETAGYSSVEEFLTHLLEKELGKIGEAADEDVGRGGPGQDEEHLRDDLGRRVPRPGRWGEQHDRDRHQHRDQGDQRRLRASCRARPVVGSGRASAVRVHRGAA